MDNKNMACIMCVICSTIFFDCSRVKCENTDAYNVQREKEPEIASEFVKFGKKTKDPLIQLLVKSFQGIEKKFYTLDMFMEKICSISICTEWSEWTKCDSKKRNRSRKCGKATSFCSEINTKTCETCADGYVGDPTQPGGSCRLQDIDLSPGVAVSPVRVEEPLGSTVVYQCHVSGEGPFNVVWSRLDSRQLPDRATVSPRYSLTIRNLERDDTSRYICTATNRYGVTRREVELIVIAADSEIDNRGNVDTQVVQVGDRVTIECIVTGTPLPTITWSRDDGPLPADVILGDGILIIPQARIEDAGTYTCLAVNEADSTSSKVILYFKGK